jgi:hypothetical protein
MPLLARNFINAKNMKGLDLSQLQPFFHDPFDDRSNHFPIQFKVFSHFLEGEFPGKQSHGLGQGMGDSFPSLCPGHALPPQSTARTEDSEGAVDDPEGFIPDREIPPASFQTSPSGHLHFSPTLPTSQTTISQSIDPCHPPFFGLHYLGHPMGFHSQTFSDISLHTHRPLTSFLFILEKPKGVGSEVSMRVQFLEKPIFHDHFREKNQKRVNLSKT